MYEKGGDAMPSVLKSFVLFLATNYIATYILNLNWKELCVVVLIEVVFISYGYMEGINQK